MQQRVRLQTPLDNKTERGVQWVRCSLSSMHVLERCVSWQEASSVSRSFNLISLWHADSLTAYSLHLDTDGDALPDIRAQRSPS